MIEQHVQYTDSELGQRILEQWEQARSQFVRVIPKDYKRMLEQIAKVEARGLTGEAALLAAFDANMRDLSRAAGN